MSVPSYKPESLDHRLTMDSVGYIYWRGDQVEHYSHDLIGDYIDTLSPKGVEKAKKLINDCLTLESLGYKPRTSTLFALWDKQNKRPGCTEILNIYRIAGKAKEGVDEHWKDSEARYIASFQGTEDVYQEYKKAYASYIDYNYIANLTQGDPELAPAEFRAVPYLE